MGKEHEYNNDPYWTDDQILAEDVHVERSPHIVRAKIHVSDESYPPRHGRSEIIPISDEPGTRDYVMIHPTSPFQKSALPSASSLPLRIQTSQSL